MYHTVGCLNIVKNKFVLFDVYINLIGSFFRSHIFLYNVFYNEENKVEEQNVNFRMYVYIVYCMRAKPSLVFQKDNCLCRDQTKTLSFYCVSIFLKIT